MEIISQQYKKLSNPTERRRMQAAAVRICEGLVARVVDEVVRAGDRTEPMQLGRIGVLVALEKHDVAQHGPFAPHAERCIRDELARWQTATGTISQLVGRLRRGSRDRPIFRIVCSHGSPTIESGTAEQAVARSPHGSSSSVRSASVG